MINERDDIPGPHQGETSVTISALCSADAPPARPVPDSRYGVRETAQPRRANGLPDAVPVALAAGAGQLLRESQLQLALAESCTGGLLASLITDVPGSSDYFLGSAVVYANSAKEAILGVRPETLTEYGAVSLETASEMAQGARRLFGADLAIAVTGIVGPTGGQPGKPVGLVYLHLSAPDAEMGERHVWDSDRAGNKRLSAGAALQLLVDYLERVGK